MTTTRRKWWPWYGFAFGCVLLVFAFGDAGAGHGTDLPLLLFGAPFSLVPVVGVLAAPIWWAIVGWSLKDQRLIAVPVMVVHTCAIVLLWWFGNPWVSREDEWRSFHRFEEFAPVWLWSGIAVHAVGVVVAWVLAIADWRRA